MLRNLLRWHPRLKIPREWHFIPTFSRAYGECRNENELRQLANRILTLNWVWSWLVLPDPYTIVNYRSCRKVVTGFVKRGGKGEQVSFQRQDASVCYRDLHTSGTHSRCKIIQILSDGGDVVLSWIWDPYSNANLHMLASSLVFIRNI